ncbi:MAG: PfkB family carbohydrate kinase [Halobacteriaceae archaeon]
MSGVVSLGSVNVDRVAYLDAERVTALGDRHDWFPGPGETVTVPADDVPPDVAGRTYENFLGGKGANQAVAAAAAGAEATLVGRVGYDQRQFGVLDSLAARGVDVGPVETVDAPTGTAYIFVDGGGESWIAIVEGANGRVDPTAVRAHADVVRDADCLLLQNEVPTAAMVAALEDLADRPDRPTVVFDPSPVDGAAAVADHDAVDVLVPNEAETTALEGTLDRFGGTVVRTRGADPVAVDPADGAGFAVTPPSVDPVDTTGAGDTFSGYLAARLAGGASLRRAVEDATVAAALQTTAEGAQRAVPDRADVAAASRSVDATF